MSKHWKVTLTADELDMCGAIGEARDKSARSLGRDPGGGSTREAVDASNHIRGARAEYAVSRALNLYWRPTIGIVDEPDVGGFIQVRSTDKRDYRLIIKPNAKDGEPYVLVYTPDMRAFFIRGWIMAGEAKRKFALTQFGTRDPAHFVPNDALKPMDVLVYRAHLRAGLVHGAAVERESEDA
jgi:hypothetical protein